MIRLALLSLTVFLVMASAAEARTCRDGRTIFKQAGYRVFESDAWFACGKGTRRPVRLWSSSGPYASFSVLGLREGKLIWIGEFSGEGGGEDTTVGWFDGKRTGSGSLAGGVSNDVLDVVVAPDGGMGVIASIARNAGTHVGYLPPRRDELVLATVGGTYAKRSLALSGNALSWRRADGQSRTVPLTGEAVACTAGTTLLEHAGVRIFEVFPNRKDQRGFQKDVLAACLPGDLEPRELASESARDQHYWEIRSLKRAGGRATFIANDHIGVLDGPSLEVARPAGYDAIDDIALGSTGALVFASQGAVVRADGTPLATLGGELQPGTLALTDDGRATWRTKAGIAQSAPLAGESALTCASGTTLLDKAGARVFEVIQAGTTRLLGCAPGMPAPAELSRGDLASKVIELARERGFVAVYVARLSDAVIVFGPGGVRVGTPGPSLGYAGIRDAAIAPDGRLALALRAGKCWTITAFTRAGRERVIARPKDGVAPGSLAFDGRRVRWRNRAGAPRAAG